MNHPVDISWLELIYATGMVLFTIALSAWQKLGLTRSILIGAMRAIVQLVLVGHILHRVFALNSWPLVLLVLLIMLLFATFSTTGRLNTSATARARLRLICGFAILTGSGLTLAYVQLCVLATTPWYAPRYLIPLFGMIVANAMNGAALAAERLQSEISARHAEIEAILALGGSMQQASLVPVQKALASAMTPTINALAVVGVVALPGMMTGQILAGTDPNLAVRYQLVVMFMLTLATAITAICTVFAYRKTFFTPHAQLRPRQEAGTD